MAESTQDLGSPALRQLNLKNLSFPSAPESWTFPAREVLGSLWNRAVFKPHVEKVRAGTSKTPLVPHFLRDNPEASEIDIKAKLFLFMIGEEPPIAEALRKLQDSECQKVQKMDPKIPEERRAQLMGKAENLVDAVMSSLREIRDGCDAAGCLPPSVGDLARAQLSCPSVDPTATKKSKLGAPQEEVALAWAKSKWSEPGYEFLTGYGTHMPSSSSDNGFGVKQEFDILVLDSQSKLVVVVEAKAGKDVYRDFPKLVAARKHFLVPNTTARLTYPKDGTSREVKIDGAPHMAYVLGAKLDEAVLVSLPFRSEPSRMLGEEVVHNMSQLKVEQTGDDAFRVAFSDEVISRTTDRIQEFGTLLQQLIASGELSVWSTDGDA